MTNKPETPEALPGLDWSSVNIEQFRGEDLSFPIDVQIIISPAFILFTLGSVRNFLQFFKNTPLEPEDGFSFKYQDEVHHSTGSEALKPTDIALALTYIDGTESTLVIDPTPTMH